MNFAKLETMLNALPNAGVPAAEIVITKSGKEIFHKVVGNNGNKKATENDLFWLFSMSKITTCVATMRLIEEGKLSLTDKLSKYIPEFSEMTVKDGDKTSVIKDAITIEHLLTMTAGFDYELEDECLKEVLKNRQSSTLEVIKAFAKKKLLFYPGTRYNYSLCHDILAGVIEVVSGMTFFEYLQKYIFIPLEMKDVGFFPSDEQKERFSKQYVYDNTTFISTEIPNENVFKLTDNYESGGAGLFAPTKEYCKLLTALSLKGTAPNGYRLLKPQTVESLQVGRLCPKALQDFVNGRFFEYNFGYCCKVHTLSPDKNLPLEFAYSKSPVGEFGWDGAANSFGFVDTKNELAVCYFTHVRDCSYGYKHIHVTMRNVIYDCLSEK